jgi:hypothetical protein
LQVLPDAVSGHREARSVIPIVVRSAPPSLLPFLCPVADSS